MDQKNALQVIEDHKNDLVYVNPEELNTQKMFIPVVTVIPATREDFHEKPINGKIMPRSYHTDKIGEAAGVEFVAENCGTRKEGATCYVGFAQGQRRMPDGTMRKSTKQEYEFDVDVRSREVFAKDKHNKYKDEIARELYIIELQKVARQRASTGARLRVIRELVGIPIAFAPNDISKALVVSRVAVNTDAMLEDPELRRHAIAMATGAKVDVFGPAIDVTPEPAALPAPDDPDDDFDDFDAPQPEPKTVNDLLEATKARRIALEDWLLNESIARSAKATKGINDVLGNADSTIEDIDAMIDRCKKYAARGDA